MARKGARVAAAIVFFAIDKLLGAATCGLQTGSAWFGDLCDSVWCVVQAFIVEAHEGLFIFFWDGGVVVSAMKLCVVLLDIACPLVGDVGLELGCLHCTRVIMDDDACVEGRWVIWVVFIVDWCEEMGKWLIVDVGQAVSKLLDAWWVGEGPGVTTQERRHCEDDVFEGSEQRGMAE